MNSTKYISNYGKITRFALIVFSIGLLTSLSLAAPPVPAPPPNGRAWAWVPGHWDLVPAPPSGAYKWQPGYWDKRKSIWIEGVWIPVSPRKGHHWVSDHYDPVTGVWITGYWRVGIAPDPDLAPGIPPGGHPSAVRNVPGRAIPGNRSIVKPGPAIADPMGREAGKNILPTSRSKIQNVPGKADKPSIGQGKVNSKKLNQGQGPGPR